MINFILETSDCLFSLILMIVESIFFIIMLISFYGVIHETRWIMKIIFQVDNNEQKDDVSDIIKENR